MQHPGLFLEYKKQARMKNGIRLSKMIVTSTHSESGCHEISMLLCRQIRQLISWTLSCFDRVIFKGHLPISRAEELQKFVDYVLKHAALRFHEEHRRRSGPNAWCSTPRITPPSSAEPTSIIQGDVDKDAWAKQQLQPTAGQGRAHRRLVRPGNLCHLQARLCRTNALFLCHAGCRSASFITTSSTRDLGLMHVRLQTWAPFTCQIYVNGHEFVARKLAQQQHPLRASRQLLHAPGRSQGGPALGQPFRQAALAENPGTNTPARSIRCLRKELKELRGHYWVSDQAEYRHRSVVLSASTPWLACSCDCWPSPC